MTIVDRLRTVALEIAELRTELAILDEQVAFHVEVAEDARIRALVSETPLADREARERREDLERMQRSRRDAAERLEALRKDQDELLDKLNVD